MDVKNTQALYRVDAPVQDMPKVERPSREANVTAEGAESARMKPVALREDKAAALPEGYMSYSKATVLEAELDKMVSMMFPNMGVSFTIHEPTGQVITRVVNRDTDKVVREFPAEKILDLIHNLCDKLGIMVDAKV